MAILEQYALLSPATCICPRCELTAVPYMRGQIQRSKRNFLLQRRPYCAIICHRCHTIIGWEEPARTATCVIVEEVRRMLAQKHIESVVAPGDANPQGVAYHQDDNVLYVQSIPIKRHDNVICVGYNHVKNCLVVKVPEELTPKLSGLIPDHTQLKRTTYYFSLFREDVFETVIDFITIIVPPRWKRVVQSILPWRQKPDFERHFCIPALLFNCFSTWWWYQKQKRNQNEKM